MAAIDNKIVVELSRIDRRLLERLTKAVEKMNNDRTPTDVNLEAKTVKVYRDASSGHYVTSTYAEAHPATTVSETVTLSEFMSMKEDDDA